MTGYLIAEEGPLAGLILRLEEGTEWVLGRDPMEATLILEDPMVSRKHVICRLTPEGIFLENLSAVNPVTQNGQVVAEPVLLHEGDILQIGSTFFRFSEHSAEAAKPPEPSSPEEVEHLGQWSLEGEGHNRWMLKVVSGPNTGAEFAMERGRSYILGKDPESSDITFQDLSVSKQHARLILDEHDHLFIEDMGSRNGVLVNGELIDERREVFSHDVIALGTTSFLIIDREEAQETIFAPPPLVAVKETAETPPFPVEAPSPAAALKAAYNWKEIPIPKRHLIMGGICCVLLLAATWAMLALFKSEPVPVGEKNEEEKIQQAIQTYPAIQFSFNVPSGKLFLTGHVLTGIEKDELLYLLKNLPFVENIDDRVVVDEYVWKNMNALLSTNSVWQGVSIYSIKPGRFALRGYLQTMEQAEALSDYVNMNFPYLDRLENQVVVEDNLKVQISGILLEKGFSNVEYALSTGDLVLSGMVDEQQSRAFEATLQDLKALMGIRSVKNFVIFTTADTSRIDLSSQYQVSGYSKKDETSFYVVVNGRILGPGDILDGMLITGVELNSVLLEKDGLKFKINYNPQ